MQKSLFKKRNIMNYNSVQDTMSALPERFKKDLAKDLSASFQFNIGNKTQCYIKIENCMCSLHQGVCDEPTVSISTDEKTWIDICNCQVGGITAAITGRLKVKGNVLTADKLIKIFGLKF